MTDFLKRLWCSNSIASFQRNICPWLFLLMVLLDAEISGIVLITPYFGVLDSVSLGFFFWLKISCLGCNECELF